MTDTTKEQILEVARKAIHTEMLSLKRMEDTLGDEFAKIGRASCRERV